MKEDMKEDVFCIEGLDIIVGDRILFREHVPIYKKLLGKIFPKWKRFNPINGIYVVTDTGSNTTVSTRNKNWKSSVYPKKF